MASSTKARKAKGRRLQQHVAAAILDKFPNLSTNDVTSTIMGDTGLDVKLSDYARQFFPYAVECKSYKTMAIYKHWDQTLNHARIEKLEPLLVIKKDRSKPLAVLDLDTLMNLIGWDGSDIRNLYGDE